MDSEKAAPAMELELVRTATLDQGRFSGLHAFEQLVREAFAQAARENWSEIIVSDANFADWPLRERSVLESLQAWSRSGRQLTILATGYDEVIRNHARFVSWRKTWAHIVDCRLCQTAPAGFPSAIVSRAWFMHRQDPLRSRGIYGQDRLRWAQIKEMLDERMRDSTPGFPASTLGL